MDECCPPPLDLPPSPRVREQASAASDSCCAPTAAAQPIIDDCCAGKEHEIAALASNAAQRRVIQTVLAINAAMFAIEFTAGIIAGSAAFMADSVDMLGDAAVYGLTLYALDRGALWKAGAALFKGGFILIFGIGVLMQIGVKLATGVPPSSPIMLAFGALALIANLACLAMLWRYRVQDVNMSSTFECSRNDVIANCGVLIAAAGVAAFASPWPDIAVAAIIAALFLRSAFTVLTRAWPEFRAA